MIQSTHTTDQHRSLYDALRHPIVLRGLLTVVTSAIALGAFQLHQGIREYRIVQQAKRHQQLKTTVDRIADFNRNGKLDSLEVIALAQAVSNPQIKDTMTYRELQDYVLTLPDTTMERLVDRYNRLAPPIKEPYRAADGPV